jgi:hypothetical protein
MMKVETKVQVTAIHIRTGIAGDCHRCAVALAVNEAIEDADCGVVEVDWMIHLIIQSRYIVAPVAVRQFVNAIDAVERKESGRPKLPRKLPEDIAPFEFTLPPFNDPAWKEECNGCECLFDPAELDDEGVCEECRKAESDGSKNRDAQDIHR